MTATDSFGDVKKFPIVRTLCKISDELIQEDPVYGKKQRAYISKLIKEYHRAVKITDKLDRDEQKFIVRLIKDEYLGRIEMSVMDEKFRNPVRNYIIGIYWKIIEK